MSGSAGHIASAFADVQLLAPVSLILLCSAGQSATEFRYSALSYLRQPLYPTCANGFIERLIGSAARAVVFLCSVVVVNSSAQVGTGIN